MSQFMIVYDRESGKAVVREFSGDDAVNQALQARFDAERTAGPNVEIATLTAASEDELRATHSRYFRSASDMFGDFEKLLAS